MALQRSTLIFYSTCIILITVGMVIGLVLHYTLPRDQVPVLRTDAVSDCVPEGGEAAYIEATCEERGCIYELHSDGAPNCTFPAAYGYTVTGNQATTLGQTYTLKRMDTVSLFEKDIANLKLDVEYYTDTLVRLKLYDADADRFEVPDEAVLVPRPTAAPPVATRKYHVNVTLEPVFSVQVYRTSTNTAVFDTSIPGLVYSDQYISVSSRLPSLNLYGLGEHNHRQFRHDLNWRKWSIFTRDTAPVDDWNLYGHQTLYTNLENDGNSNGVLLLNSNAMDVVMQPSPYPAINYRVIGGILDFYIFLGPTPENVVQQYTAATGRPLMPPYWSLGYQLSRWDYDNLTHVREIVDRTRAADIPHDVQYGDIDYMESKLDFSYDLVKYQGLPEFVDEIHARGQHYIIILDHAIGSNQTVFDEKLGGVYPPFSDIFKYDVFVKDPRNTSTFLQGEVWPGPVVYPDYSKLDQATLYWSDQCYGFYNNSDGYRGGIKYDALWIDMNEPSNFVPGSSTGCPRNTLNYPPYRPHILDGGSGEGEMFDKTICMDAETAWGKQYDTHSLYGHSMSIVTHRSLSALFPSTRPLVLTRSNFVGTQRYAAHWLGDNQSQWSNIPWSIIGMLEYSLFGFSYTGADICGFWYAAELEMCTRWNQLGAFYPFARNHNAATWPDQDPAAFGDEHVAIVRDVLHTRYKLLPYLYTLLHLAHTTGSTVVRPLLHEFPTDSRTWTVDRQFLWGAALLISPVMDEGHRHVEAYFPNTRWYNYYGGREVAGVGVTHNLSAPLESINLHVRGGHVLPWQEPANTTVFSRQKPMGLTVALGDAPTYPATGSLFWDDGDSNGTYYRGEYLELSFNCENHVLEIQVVHNVTADYTLLDFTTLVVWGLPRAPRDVYVDDSPIANGQFNFDGYTHALTIIDQSLPIDQNHKVEWQLIS